MPPSFWLRASGHGRERLVAAPCAARRRNGVPGFQLARRVERFWDRSDRAGKQIAIDLVTRDEATQPIRRGTRKRQRDELVADLPSLARRDAVFAAAMPRFAAWRVERGAIAPTRTPEPRASIPAAVCRAQDLGDLTAGR